MFKNNNKFNSKLMQKNKKIMFTNCFLKEIIKKQTSSKSLLFQYWLTYYEIHWILIKI